MWCVKLADRITNMLPPPDHWTPDHLGVYRDEAKRILTALGDAHAGLAKRLEGKIGSYGRAGR